MEEIGINARERMSHFYQTKLWMNEFFYVLYLCNFIYWTELLLNTLFVIVCILFIKNNWANLLFYLQN